MLLPDKDKRGAGLRRQEQDSSNESIPEKSAGFFTAEAQRRKVTQRIQGPELSPNIEF